MTLELDRIEIESAGSDPVRLAHALVKQLPDLDGRVPIKEIALSLDILAVERASLYSIEACLQCDPQKSHGQIVVNARSSRQRQRYSIGHELGHFLNECHEPTGHVGFDCTTQDMASPLRDGRHQRQEQEANMFAIEVLAPRRLLDRHLTHSADLEHALAMANRFDISRAAAARRYVDLHAECLAAVFSKAGKIQYVVRPEGFPSLTRWSSAEVGPVPDAPEDGSSLTGLEEVSADGWLARPDDFALFAQTLYQRDGHTTTMLLAEREVAFESSQEPVFHRSFQKP